MILWKVAPAWCWNKPKIRKVRRLASTVYYSPFARDESISGVPDGAAHLLLEGGEGDHPVGGEQAYLDIPMNTSLLQNWTNFVQSSIGQTFCGIVLGTGYIVWLFLLQFQINKILLFRMIFCLCLIANIVLFFISEDLFSP